jgi:hypothetical protein
MAQGSTARLHGRVTLSEIPASTGFVPMEQHRKAWGVFHNPTRERGIGRRHRGSDVGRSLAHASGYDGPQACNVKRDKTLDTSV